MPVSLVFASRTTAGNETVTAPRVSPRDLREGKGLLRLIDRHATIPRTRKTRKPAKNIAVATGVSGTSWASASSSSVTK